MPPPRRHLASLARVLPLLALLLPSLAGAEEPSRKLEVKPLVVGDEDGPASLRIAFTLQGMYEMLVVDVETDDARIDDYGARFRRVRFVFGGHLATPKLTWRLQMSTLPGSLELLDLTLNYAFLPQFQLMTGNFKIPFTRYRLNSFKNLSAVDWDLPTPYFGAERQKGIVAHNGFGKLEGFEYSVGLFTGVAARGPHAKGLADIHGETLRSYSDLTQRPRLEKIHPEIVVHLAWNHGGMQHRPEADLEGGPLRMSAGLSLAWDTRPDPVRDVSIRIAPEFWMKVHGFAFHATGYLGFFERGGDLLDTQLALAALVTRAGYTIRHMAEVALQYALVHARPVLLDHARDRADGIIAAATDPDEIAALTERYADAGTLEYMHAFSLILDFFMIDGLIRWSNDLTWLVTDSRSASSAHEIRFRAQLQLDF